MFETKLKQSFWNSLYIVIFSAEWLKRLWKYKCMMFCERGRDIHAVYATKYFKYWMKEYLVFEKSTVSFCNVQIASFFFFFLKNKNNDRNEMKKRNIDSTTSTQLKHLPFLIPCLFYWAMHFVLINLKIVCFHKWR